MHILTRLSIFVILIASCFGFLSNPYLDTAGTDSSIFLYVARMLNIGDVPYLNVFDHKGPLIYFIDSLGLQISEKSFLGIWILDCLVYLAALYVAFIMSHRYVKLISSLVMTLLFASIYHLVACGGNMPEMYIILFALIAYSICLKGGDGWNSFYCIVMGACIGAIFMLKFNMISVLCPITVCWFRSQNKSKNLFFLILGFTIVILPIVFYLLVNDALLSFWDIYFIYNKQYSGSLNWIPEINRGFFIFSILFCIAIYQCLFGNFDKKMKSLLVYNLLYFVAAWSLVILSGGTFRYYGPVLPACVLPLAIMVNKIRFWMSIVIIVFASIVLSVTVIQRNIQHNDRRRTVELLKIRPEIKNLDSLTVVGCDCLAYFRLKATSPTRFPYQGTIAAASKEYQKQIVSDIVSGKSKYLLVPSNVWDMNYPLDMTWAKRYIPLYYNLIVKTEYYSLYKWINEMKE